MKPLSVAVSVLLALVVGTVFGRWSARLDAPAEVKPVAMPSAGFLPGRASALAPAATAAPDEGQHPTTVTGVVREVIQVPNYTYLRLEQPEGGEAWAAVETTTAATAGAQASITDAVMMHDFASKALGRTFSEIYFGRLGAR